MSGWGWTEFLQKWDIIPLGDSGICVKKKSLQQWVGLVRTPFRVSGIGQNSFLREELVEILQKQAKFTNELNWSKFLQKNEGI